MPLFSLKAGSVPGKDHLFMQANCQDKYRWDSFEQNSKLYQAGIVCDGCGSAEQSEVGAALLAEFGVAEIERLIGQGCSMADLPEKLYRESLGFLAEISHLVAGEKDSPSRATAFIGRYLLATILGFVTNEEQTLIFAAGDGLIIVNDRLENRDEANRPDYLAYGLLKPDELSSPAPLRQTFDFKLLPTNSIERLAVWTDGFDPALTPEIWNLNGPRGLQRKLNIWSKRKLLTDDTTGITLERVQNASNN
jgi:hypothetical protein